MYNKKFISFLESMKTHNPALIEAIKTGFKICFENESSHNLQLLVNALNTQKPNFFYSETYHGPDAGEYQYECETESANIKNNTIIINVYRKSGHDYTWDNAQHTSIIVTPEEATDILKTNSFYRDHHE